MRSTNHICLLFLLLITAPCLLAQGWKDHATDQPGYGIFGNFGLNNHTADLRGLPGVPSCCPQYTSGDGTGYAFGLLYEMPLATPLALAVRASFMSYGAELSAREASTVGVGVGGVPTLAVIEHTIDARLSSFGIEPLIGVRLFGGLSVHAGLHAGMVVSKSFAQKEVLVEPAGTGAFENGLRTRNEHSGDIPQASSLYVGALGGLSYGLSMNREGSLFFVPELLYMHSVTKVASGLAWNANAVRAGVAVMYSPRP